MNQKEFNRILKLHELWINGDPHGKKADLRHTDLRKIDMRWVNMRGADMRGADMRWVNMRGADMREANMRGANMRRANMRGANMQGADMQGADMRGADMRWADMRGADIRKARLPHFQIVPETGGFYAWKALSGGVVIKVYVPAGAKRTSTLIGRKCRASHVKVCSDVKKVRSWRHEAATYYTKGETVYADKFDDDICIGCTHGIHFFMTKQEAEEWAKQ